ncbi:FkbM family methyltransferase [Ruegeria marina]|uniref:Methyltransferase, FkbM family n=1 Tax=Ruegeria marina TaxID=639004 RepID=A0A1G6QP23_9RHOB|nr:FkbM family methyltransferase [Ruegeria marina]SDC93397.1 methyltransferase, FkbM family [Ruegeria marina]
MLTGLRKMIYRARGHVPGRLNGEPFRLDPYHSRFWRKATAGHWEPETFAVLDRHLSPDRDYLDIGAWIGPTVLYAARKARHVWCFEPDPVAFRHLVWNLDLNNISNVSAFGVALSDRFGVARMGSFGGEAGDSMTSLLAPGEAGRDALTINWDQFAQTVDLSGVSLVKMDVEGAEFSVVPTLTDWLRTHRPAFYLSTHAPFLQEGQRTEAMAGLAQELSFYTSATDETGATADLTAPEAQSRFRSFLFTR